MRKNGINESYKNRQTKNNDPAGECALAVECTSMRIFQNLSIKNKLIVLVLSIAMSVIGIGFFILVAASISSWKTDMINNTRTTAEFLADNCSVPISFGPDYYDEVEMEIKKLDLQPGIVRGVIYDSNDQKIAQYPKNKTADYSLPDKPPHKEDFLEFEGNYLHLYKPIIYKLAERNATETETETNPANDRESKKAIKEEVERNNEQKTIPRGGSESVASEGTHTPQVGEQLGVLYIMASTGQLKKKINDFLVYTLLVTVGLILLTYILAARFQGIISNPILKLAGVTGEITAKADYSVRVKKVGEDEIGILYNGFNNMLEQIQVREEQRDRAEAEQQRLMLQLKEKNEKLQHLMSELKEKNKELEQVVYVTSHDLRSPLVNIQGFSKELGFSLEEMSSLINSYEISPDLKQKLSFILNEDIPDSLKYILSSTSKMDSLLSGLLKLSRVGRSATTLSNVDMNELISEINNAFEFHLKEAGVEFRMGDLPPCYGNDVELNQMFSNLVSNALKYLDPKRPGKISVNGRLEDDHVVYSVEDNGVGIAREHQKKVFEIFHRLNPHDTEGDGLGLTIVNKIVSRYSGKVWVESDPGKGSTFFISLPTIKQVNDEPKEKTEKV
jgi:signal transduction histidine kinase